jgi:SAM-dependent methyltransferase
MENENIWYENDSFWQSFEPVLFNKKRIEQTLSEVDQIIQLLNMNERMKILDLACGPGRHAIEFARRKYRVTGVDRTQFYLDKARDLAATENLQIQLIRSDMRNFIRENEFDVALNLFSSFGYFENPDDDQKVLENIYHSLKSGGHLLLDMVGKEIVARIFQEKGWQEIDGHLWLEDRRITDNWGYIENRWILISDNKRAEHNFRLRLYSAAELTSLLIQCGFKEIKVYGNLIGSDYNHRAERLIVSAQKQNDSDV